ncbi:MAG: hypothetical protein US50_C0009G0010 [Candidatus Nomurabacteria bacterium GW2011_GWB1_37_5]|uniref:Type IV secretory pathway VirB4 component-like protein n=1 Tax=Candidatus Nomurabacteria bacterium GW2011_GWB1_37_5 TaxID=1618742 RepID=A0A0G0JFX3_9BACT|nr:MAG: hypothetical protein US50_C0009G0010 [Candidatus Nomurabacteria bacterium GW2011_GWB1_37_5]
MAIAAKPSQNFVPIKEVRDGIIILKDGGLRVVMLASSINLSLKSYDEQKAVLIQYQNFLNSLDFSTQIVIQSRRYDIRPYLASLEKRLNEIPEPLLKIQTREYIEFIRTFTEQVNIMTKRFFIIVPYSQTAPSFGAAKSILPGGKSKSAEEQSFEEKRSQLEQRMSVIESGLSGVGVKTAKLGTEEVIELFYKTYNPGETEREAKK